LDPARFDVSFACSEFDERIFRDTAFERHIVHSLEPKAVLRAVRQGRRLYDERLLRQQIAEDRSVFEAVRPDLVVGDFRWSLAVSASIFGVPHAALVNAYWSPYCERQAFPVPDHPLLRILGESLTARYFPVAMPKVFAWFAKPLNTLRREYGLSEIGSLPDVLTHGDYTLYADPEQLVPTPNAPSTHVHLGFVPWAPDAPLPPALHGGPADAPLVYATLGSSGDLDVLPKVLEAISVLPVRGLVATAGRERISAVPSNVTLVDYVPGDAAARRAAVVITNGGSSSSYQALAEGTPVLGLPSNLDQFLAMQAIEREGAGISLRASSVSVGTLTSTLRALLASESHRVSAGVVQRMIHAAPAVERFAAFVSRVTRNPEEISYSCHTSSAALLHE
jgi:UDP:flavonoid glycosyltransferase YjiC (YdhE family)